MEATVDPTLACSVVTCFGRQWELQEFTDFTVCIDGKDFKCHRIILEACSKFFCGSQNVCSRNDIKPEIFELILEILYKGRNILNVDNAFNIWAAACKLEIGFLIQVCEEFVMGMITVNNYMGIYKMAVSMNSWKVLHAVRQKIVQELHHVMFSDFFLELTLDDVWAIMGSRDIKVCSNGLVQAVLTWVRAEVCDGWDKERRDGSSCPANTIDVNRSGIVDAISKTSDRRKNLGILLEAVHHLEGISDDCLTQLLNDEFVITCPRAVRAVNSIAVRRFNTGRMSYRSTCTSSGACLLHQTNQQLLENLGPSSQTPLGAATCTSTVDPVLACGVMTCLGRFWDLQILSDISDFQVQVGGKTFKCHKFILGSCSEFFAGLLRSDMREKAESSAEIQGIRSCVFELVLDSLYTGRNILTMNTVIEVWHAANQLQIVFLLKACEEFIMSRITIESCVDIFTNATILMSSDVLQAAKQFIIQHFVQVISSESFSNFSVNDLLDIFGSKNMDVCANCMVRCILKWVNMNVVTSATTDMKVGNESMGFVNSMSSETLHMDTITPVFSERLNNLEKLMAAVKLETITDDCLRELMSNEIVQATPSFIRPVNAIAAQRLNAQVEMPFQRVPPDVRYGNCSGNDYCSLHQGTRNYRSRKVRKR